MVSDHGSEAFKSFPKKNQNRESETKIIIPYMRDKRN